MFFEFTKASMSNTGIQATYMSENVCWPAGPLWGTKRQNVLQDFLSTGLLTQAGAWYLNETSLKQIG